MRVLHISYTTRWGAGKSLLRMHQALVRNGTDSHILVADRTVPSGERIHRFDQLVPTAGKAQSAVEDVSESGRNLLLAFETCNHIYTSPLLRSADVVELRQLHAGRALPFFDVKILTDIQRTKPIIWRFSDAWAFTGACVYPFDCTGWLHGCTECPFVAAPDKTESLIPDQNTIALDFLTKRIFIGQTPMHIVCPSRWLLDLAKQSFLQSSHNKSFHYIPVGVDTDVFQERQTNQHRESLGFNGGDVVLLINAPDLDNYRKGADLLTAAMQTMDTRELSLLVIGDKAMQGAERMFKRVVCTGYLDTDVELAAVYGASDIFLFPSRQDNSAQSLLEASASGLPIVAFDTGGNADYVHHEQSGLLVPLADTQAFAKATMTLVKSKDLREKLGRSGQALMRQSFTTKHQTEAFLKLYDQVSRQGLTGNTQEQGE